RLRKMMQLHVNFHTQTRFVRALNREFTALAKEERFATAVAFTYDAPLNRLLVCNAGHPLPAIFRRRNAAWGALASELGNLPLGIDDVEYQQFQPAVEFGDLVLCYTDALLECRRGDDMLGQTGLSEHLARLDTNKPEALIQQLIASITAAGWNFDDDLTVLLFRPNGKRKRVPLFDRVLVPFRIIPWGVKVLLPVRA